MEHCQTKCHVAYVIYNELSKYSAVSFLFLFLVQSKFRQKSWTGRQIHRIFSVVHVLIIFSEMEELPIKKNINLTFSLIDSQTPPFAKTHVSY